MHANPFVGVGLHSIGAFSAASCYTPQKQTKLWAWEIYWITQATCAWLILPIIGAFLTFPNYLEILAACPTDVMVRTFLLGVLYGFGGLMFGLGIRYIGFSLNYAIAIGISAGVGTLAPLIWHPNHGFVWKLAEKFRDLPGYVVLAGILLSLVGIVFCGVAGALREQSGGDAPTRFSFKLGVPLAVMAGILSSVFNYSLLAGGPLADEAEERANQAVATAADHSTAPPAKPKEDVEATDQEESETVNVNGLLKMNAIYPFSHGGAWVTSFIWCLILIRRNRTASQLVRLPGKVAGRLSFYYLMALLSGAFWYFQFFFYGMGNANMGEKYEFTSWALHMAMLILFSNVYGKLFREWEGASLKARSILYAGMAIIVVATLIIAYGNYLGQLPETTEAVAMLAGR